MGNCLQKKKLPGNMELGGPMGVSQRSNGCIVENSVNGGEINRGVGGGSSGSIRRSPNTGASMRQSGRERKSTRSSNHIKPIGSHAPPVPPMLHQNTTKKLKMRALYQLIPTEGVELALQVDDDLIALEDVEGKDWFKAKNMRTGEQGLVPYNYVKKMDGRVETEEWYFDINRAQAEESLQFMGNPCGTFLVRPSTEKPNHALSVRILDEHNKWVVKHLKITVKNNQAFIHDSLQFSTVPELISYYYKNVLTEGHKLEKPLPREPPDVPFKDFEVDRTNFIILELLGAGNFGEVQKAKWGQRSKTFVAIKMIKPGSMSNAEFLAEAQIMHQLRHEHIVRLLGVSTQPAHEPTYIITEFMDKGSLLDYLRKGDGRNLNGDVLINFMGQIASGMMYLEDKKYCHRDLRAANILVNSQLIVKVADFGLSKLVVENDNSDGMTHFPVRWAAPEVLKTRRGTIKSDVWSFGVLMFEIISKGETPYKGMSNEELKRKINLEDYIMPKPSIPECTVKLYEIMEECWKKDPNNRPTFEFLNDILGKWHISSETNYT